jgi:myo-inositol 2-dehydrogenase / D-chiro-inositol 1-dehydrogenase
MGSDRVRIALIGAGRMGRVHLSALDLADGIALTGVVDPFEPAREALDRRGLRTFADVDQLLASETIDGVLIAAPSDQHLELVRRFAGAGLPMLCEKPIGVHVEDAVKAVAAARDGGVLLQVGYWRRFVPALRRLRERIRAGELGDISLIACHQWDEMPPSAEFRAHSGGIAVDMAVHEFDQVRWLTGREVQRVSAASSAAGAPAGDPDVVAILAQLSGAAAAVITLGRRFALGDSCWLEAFGTDGYERVEFMWGKEGEAVFRSAVLAQLKAFAQAVREGIPLGAGGEDAIAALAAAELAGDALTDGSSRELPTAIHAVP